MKTEKRLIDANDILLGIETFKQCYRKIESPCSKVVITALTMVAELVNRTPTVNAVEVVHGRWTEAEDGDGAVCSVCGEDFCNVYLEVERFLYCPECGAKMDGDRNGEA